jgi:hypothetical protein
MKQVPIFDMTEQETSEFALWCGHATSLSELIVSYEQRIWRDKFGRNIRLGKVQLNLLYPLISQRIHQAGGEHELKFGNGRTLVSALYRSPDGEKFTVHFPQGAP